MDERHTGVELGSCAWLRLIILQDSQTDPFSQESRKAKVQNAGGATRRCDGSGSEAVAKHRQAALRFGFGRFILQNVPVFSEAAVLDPDNIRGDPSNRPAIS